MEPTFFLIYTILVTFVLKDHLQVYLILSSLYFVLNKLLALSWEINFAGIIAIFGVLFLLSCLLTIEIQGEANEMFLLFFFGLIGLIVASETDSLLTIGLGLELQAFCGYILLSICGTLRSAESALKYFLIGVIATSIYFLGLVFLPTLNLLPLTLDQSGQRIDEFNESVLGIMLIIIAFLFKIGAAPFHLWMPEAYQTASYSVLLYLLVLPKIYLFFILYNLIALCKMNHMIILSILISAVIGASFALLQTKIKAFLAYTIIFNNAFFLALSWVNTNTTSCF